ncbi:MAG TPA: DOMON domain-containing protein [Candidatus Edwardsbacteria bacterium]|nr:DOMON domain-containing protein [Candidatus Edwardsbacteria bacterium]
MKRSIFLLLAAIIATAAFAGETPPRKVPVVTGTAPVIDGAVAKGEYAATFTDPGTGITVSWQADTAVLSCALQSPGKGWLAIGFGSDGMNGADMAIAYVDTSGKWTVEEQLGKSFFRHVRAEKQSLAAGAAALSQGRTVMEFAIPLAMPNGKAIGGAALPFILAYHKDKTSFSKHTKRSSGTMVLDPGSPKK